MRITSALICILWCITSGCTKEIDLEIPTSDDPLVLNGILHPDSLVRVTLTKSSDLEDTSGTFSAVGGAMVRLWEDQELVGILAYENEAYTIDYYPLAGKQYTVEVEVAGYDKLQATDRVPSTLNMTACYKMDASFSASGSTSLQIDIEDNKGEENYYWIALLGRYLNEDSIVTTYKIHTLLSHSTLTDRFNSFIDNTSGGVRAYDDYIRIEDRVLEGDSASLDISTSSPLFRISTTGQWDSSQSHTLSVVSASHHYDRYLKSSIIYYFDNEFYDNPSPFAEPTRIYSNVENGIGIFAACNSVNIDVENFLCH